MAEDTLSVVEAIWNLPGTWLDCNLHTLSNQTRPPLEIVVTNSSSDRDLFREAAEVCAKYPLVRMVVARRDRLNLSHSLNVAIRASQGTYTMIGNMDRLFAPNFLEEVYGLMAPNLMVTCGNFVLPMDLDLGDPDGLSERWDWLVAQGRPSKQHAVGTMMCMERAWLFKVHGFDEARCPLLYCDSDLILRGGKDGWDDSRFVRGDVAPVLHIGHPDRVEQGFGGKYPDMSLPVVRNPWGWGQIHERGD